MAIAMASALSTVAVLTACAPHTEGQVIDDQLLEVAGAIEPTAFPLESGGEVDAPCDGDYEVVEGGLQPEPLPEPLPEADPFPGVDDDPEPIAHFAGGIGPAPEDLEPMPIEPDPSEEIVPITPPREETMVRGGIGRAEIPEDDSPF